MPSYSFKIITPQGKALETEVEHIRLPGENGYVGVLSSHAPYLTSSAGGQIAVREKGGKEKLFSVGSGFFEVRANEAIFMTEKFSDPENSES